MALKRNYITGSGVANIALLIAEVLGMCEGILTSYNKTGRVTKAPDQTFDRIIGSFATRVNKNREARALANGQTDFTRVTKYDVLVGIHTGDEEYAFSQYDEVDAANKMLKVCGKETYITPEDAAQLFDALVVRYASHPSAVKEDGERYISLEDLEDSAIDAPPRKDPLKANKSAPNGAEPVTV